MNVWVSTYLGFPDCVALDQGPQFQSQEFLSLLSSAGIVVHPSGIESHNALGNGERYHAYLRKVYTKIRDEVPNLKKEDALRLAIKAFNDTAGPHGLVPTLPVFGVLPRLPIHPRDLPDQRDRMRAMQLARSEMAREIAKARVHVALRRNFPAAADADVKILDQVLVYLEKPVNKWLGPFTVIDFNDKSVYVNINGKTSRYSVDKVKVYQSDNDADNNDDHDHDASPGLTDNVNDTQNGNEHNDYPIAPATDELIRDNDADEYGKALNRYWNMNKDDDGPDINAFTVTILKPTDERAKHEYFNVAKSDEVDGITKMHVWEKVDEKDIPKGANVLGGGAIHFDIEEQ